MFPFHNSVREISDFVKVTAASQARGWLIVNSKLPDLDSWLTPQNSWRYYNPAVVKRTGNASAFVDHGGFGPAWLSGMGRRIRAV